MKTEEIQQALKKIHSKGRGELRVFALRNNLDYVSLFKLATQRNKEILHNHALRVISSLKAEKLVS